MPQEVTDRAIELGVRQKSVTELQLHSQNRLLEEAMGPNDVNITGVCDCKDEESEGSDSVQSDNSDDIDAENDDTEENDSENENLEKIENSDMENDDIDHAEETNNVIDNEEEVTMAEAQMVEDINGNDNTEEICETRSGRKAVTLKDCEPSMLHQRHAETFGLTVKHVFTQHSLKVW